MNRQYNVAILGAGNIANSMAEAIKGLASQEANGISVNPYAVGSRSLEKAQAFSNKYGFEKAYGSYEELVKDPAVDLIYVATPHSHHFEHAKLCVLNGKACLVEKAFTANTKQACELLELAVEKKVLVQEAMWTRFLPAADLIKQIIAEGQLGQLVGVEGEFSLPISHIERMWKPELAGGALLDLGIYPLTFASMYLGNDIDSIATSCLKYKSGVDGTDEINFIYKDGKKAKLRCSMLSGPINEGYIVGTKAKLFVRDLNNYSEITLQSLEGKAIKAYPIPKQINGYEYELLASLRALEEGRLFCQEMPHEMTLEMMRQMDKLRKEWGIVYPFEK